MKRFWYSFIADDQRSIGGNPPSTFFCSGYTADDRVTMCVCAEAESAEALAALVKDARFYPEAEERFCEPVADDWTPSSRFPGAHLWQTSAPEQLGPKLN